MIKNNWFKISIVLIFLILAVYIVNWMDTQNRLEVVEALNNCMNKETSEARMLLGLGPDCEELREEYLRLE